MERFLPLTVGKRRASNPVWFTAVDSNTRKSPHSTSTTGEPAVVDTPTNSNGSRELITTPPHTSTPLPDGKSTSPPPVSATRSSRVSEVDSTNAPPTSTTDRLLASVSQTTSSVGSAQVGTPTNSNGSQEPTATLPLPTPPLPPPDGKSTSPPPISITSSSRVSGADSTNALPTPTTDQLPASIPQTTPSAGHAQTRTSESPNVPSPENSTRPGLKTRSRAVHVTSTSTWSTEALSSIVPTPTITATSWAATITPIRTEVSTIEPPAVTGNLPAIDLKSPTNIGAVIGGTIGAVIIALAASLLVLFLFRRRRRSEAAHLLFSTNHDSFSPSVLEPTFHPSSLGYPAPASSVPSFGSYRQNDVGRMRDYNYALLSSLIFPHANGPPTGIIPEYPAQSGDRHRGTEQNDIARGSNKDMSGSSLVDQDPIEYQWRTVPATTTPSMDGTELGGAASRNSVYGIAI